MRWDGQRIDGDGAGTDAAAGLLPGMPSARGLLRSVEVAEFPGVTFHEVRARSALNAVPETSGVPFRWTINPYRGCTHACVYCLAPDTPVLLADGTTAPVADLQVGDAIVGTEQRADGRRYVVTEVLARWSTTEEAHRVTLADGTELTASGEHRFLTARGWVYVAPAPRGRARRASLAPGDELAGPGAVPQSAPRRARGAVLERATTPLLGRPVTGGEGTRVVSVEPLGAEQPMVDLTTGTGDFVAGGVVSHNCFARGTHSWLELDAASFDDQVVVKTNVVDVLRRELGRASWKREHVALGTNTDPYQRAEGRYRLMPGIIRALAGSGTPFSVLTKGTLARRDVPLLAAAARDVPIGFGVSVAIMDDALHAALEPGVPTPRARLDLVRALADAGLPCGVFLAPVLPGLTDSQDHLDRALAEIAAAGATGVTVVPLHLRPGAREWFSGWLEREHPTLVPRYRTLYGRGAYVPAEYRTWLAGRVAPLLARHGLDGRSGGRARGAGWVERQGAPGDADAAFPAGSLPATVARAASPEEPADAAEQLSLL